MARSSPSPTDHEQDLRANLKRLQDGMREGEMHTLSDLCDVVVNLVALLSAKGVIDVEA